MAKYEPKCEMWSLHKHNHIQRLKSNGSNRREITEFVSSPIVKFEFDQCLCCTGKAPHVHELDTAGWGCLADSEAVK